MEKRNDLYINLFNPNYGLKIRSFSQNNSLLELKILRKTRDDFEFWEKPIKIAIHSERIEKIVREIPEILENFRKITPEVNEIITILSSNKFDLIQFSKRRQKISINNLSIEFVELEFKDRKHYGIQLESHDLSLFTSFRKKTINIPFEKYSNTSYPQLILQN